MYVCSSCKKDIEQLEGFVRCPYCASRVVFKPALPVARTVKSK